MATKASQNRRRDKQERQSIQLGRVLRRLVEAEKPEMTQRQLAADLRISAPTLTSLLHGGTPSLDVVVRIALYFGVSLDYLVLDRGLVIPARNESAAVAYVQQALWSIQNRDDARFALEIRLAEHLRTSLDAATTAIIERSDPSVLTPGLQTETETLRLESFSRRSIVCSIDPHEDVIGAGTPNAIPGRFLRVMADNLRRGRSYQLVFPRDRRSDDHWNQLRRDYQRLLAALGVSIEQWIEHVQVLVRDLPLFNGWALYELDVDELATNEPLLFERVRASLVDGWIGIAIPPSGSNSDSLMDERHLQRALVVVDDVLRPKNQTRRATRRPQKA